MKIVHLDVDRDIEPYLNDKKISATLQDLNQKVIGETEIITLKSKSQVNEETLSSLPSLKLIVTRTVGVDHIDLEACKKRKIAVYHVVDYGSFNIAEHVFALLLSGSRHICNSQKEIQQGRFSYEHFLGFSLREKTLGVIGTGRIGLEVIKIAKGFGMNIVAYDIYQNEKARQNLGYSYVSLDELFKKSDVITLHAPAMKETEHLINGEAIKKMKKGVILINTARGALIDEEALEKSIKKFRFVGLDVLEDEAHFSKGHPLLKYNNVIITPHVAFFTDASVKKIAEETYKCIANFRNGNKEGRVIE